MSIVATLGAKRGDVVVVVCACFSCYTFSSLEGEKREKVFDNEVAYKVSRIIRNFFFFSLVLAGGTRKPRPFSLSNLFLFFSFVFF